MIMNPELAEICGIHAGDGYLRKRQKNKTELDISGSIEEKEYYDNPVIPLFNKTFNLKIKGRFFSRGTYGFVIWNKNIGNLFYDLGFPYGKKSKIVSVPELILDSENRLFHSRFLRGLFDTDGCLTFKRRYSENYSKFKQEHHYYPILTLTTISKQLCDDSCFILKKLKIKYFLYSYKPLDPKESYKYVIIISGVERLNLWMKLIGIKNPSKLSRYFIWKKFGFCPPNLTFQQRKDILSGKLDINSIKGS